jgi:hypothetical protein
VSYKGSKEDIDNGDESLCEENGLPEVQWLAHLRQEGDKQQSSRVGV